VFSMTGGNARNAIGARRNTVELMSDSFFNICNICFNAFSKCNYTIPIFIHELISVLGSKCMYVTYDENVDKTMK